MDPYSDARMALEARITGKMVAKLYLTLVPTSGDTRERMEKTLEYYDRMMGWNRLPPAEMRRGVEDLLASGQVPDDKMIRTLVPELVTFGQLEFGVEFGDDLDILT